MSDFVVVLPKPTGWQSESHCSPEVAVMEEKKPRPALGSPLLSLTTRILHRFVALGVVLIEQFSTTIGRRPDPWPSRAGNHISDTTPLHHKPIPLSSRTVGQRKEKKNSLRQDSISPLRAWIDRSVKEQNLASTMPKVDNIKPKEDIGRYSEGHRHKCSGELDIAEMAQDVLVWPSMARERRSAWRGHIGHRRCRGRPRGQRQSSLEMATEMPYQKGEIGITIMTPWFDPKFNTEASRNASSRALDFLIGW
ncbi:hypothetical protein TIFTF001_024449 [Ficus carica]|uniref:Uncharacterized protein n=1 Tax=Ficus carica TaxID=3494 RepID=A0AA88DDB0_FICCA|nr:hypothetical protein TIFTF001_024449 [Ficus carica]